MDLTAALLTRLSRLNTAKLEEHAGARGTTSSELAVLTALRLGGGVRNPSELTKLVVQTPGGLTKTLRRLEDAGLIRREPDPQDRRALLAALTAAGRRAADRALAESDRYYSDLLSDLSGDDRERLTELLGKVVDRLEAMTRMTSSLTSGPFVPGPSGRSSRRQPVRDPSSP